MISTPGGSGSESDGDPVAGRQLRIALIGFGAAGQVFHAPLISATPGLHLAAIVTGDPERKDQAATSYPDAAIVDSVDGVLAAADDFDAVVIATPNRTHYQLARATIAAGLATVVDKPLATTVVEGNDLVLVAHTAGVPLTVFQNRRWDSAFLTARQLARSGRLGAIHRLEIRHERWRPTLKGGWRELGDPTEAGGLLFDIGAHLLDQALQLLGPVHQVYAELDIRRTDARADDDTFIALHHANGARSHLTMTVMTADPNPVVRLLGDYGTYSQHGMDRQEEAMRAGIRPDSSDWDRAVDPGLGRLTIDAQTEQVVPQPGTHIEFYKQLAAHLRGEGPVPVDPLDAVTVLGVIHAAHRSARLTRPVAIP